MCHRVVCQRGAAILPAVSLVVDVIGLGENSVDRVRVAPRPPSAVPKARVARIDAAAGDLRLCGGQVATAMAACAALGLRAAYAGAIGRDVDGALIRATLTGFGVEVTNLHERDAATRTALILVDPASGDRSVYWQRDSALDLTTAEVDAIPLTGARAVHVDDTDLDASIRLARRARQAGLIVTTDVDAETGPGVRDLMALATHLIFSEAALARLSGEGDPADGLRATRRRCASVLVVTLGPRGSMALDSDPGATVLAVPAPQVTAVDTTGAGDVFRAGCLKGLLDGRPLADTLALANAAAAMSCTKIGAVGGIPTALELTNWRALHDSNVRPPGS